MAADMRAQVRPGAAVEAVTRGPDGVRVKAAGQEAEPFDSVVLACHSDTALALLKDPTPRERRILDRIPFRRNRLVLHTDARLMPRRRACWSSWVYLANSRPDEERASVTYWMNSLQGIPDATPLFATLNPPMPVDESLILDEHTFDHPRFDSAAFAAQARLPSIQGRAGHMVLRGLDRHGLSRGRPGERGPRRRAIRSVAAMALIGPSVVKARVSHARRVPVKNRFAYGMDYLLLDEAALGAGGPWQQPRGTHRRSNAAGLLPRAARPGPKLFSYGRPNVVSLHPSDHGVTGLNGLNGIEGVRRLAKEAGVDGADRVLLLTHPRYWGFTFNPVSFWFLLSGRGRLRAVLAEVHNTFGERHGYLCAAEDGADIGPGSTTVSAKRFHVSPFFDIEGEYRFRFRLEGDRVAVSIRYDDGAGGGLNTSIAGTRRPFTDGELARALLRRPFGAARALALIHFQALRLYRKGVRYRKRPRLPERPIT